MNIQLVLWWESLTGNMKNVHSGIFAVLQEGLISLLNRIKPNQITFKWIEQESRELKWPEQKLVQNLSPWVHFGQPEGNFEDFMALKLFLHWKKSGQKSKTFWTPPPPRPTTYGTFYSQKQDIKFRMIGLTCGLCQWISFSMLFECLH